LAYYAREFPTVELNAPFYRLPTADTFRRWRCAVPPGFVFAVKASRYLTHVTRLRAPAQPLRRLLRRLRRLGPTLGPLLLQLPPGFHRDLDRLDRLLAVLRRQRTVPSLRVALEVRHASWIVPEVLRRLRGAGVALCLSDWPGLEVPPIPTAPFVYVRRHGYGARYAGRYPAARLAADAARIRRWLAAGRDVYVYFNNDALAQAVQDARRLRALLAARAPARGAE
jgi:uncharacterized protein YecE (DUF72 family)